MHKRVKLRFNLRREMLLGNGGRGRMVEGIPKPGPKAESPVENVH
jgi:hypothetical protein